MNDLEELKQHWKAQKFERQFSKEELYAMLKQRSKNAVQWILNLSIAEFIFYLIFPILIPDSYEYYSYYKEFNLYGFAVGITVLSYLLLLYYIVVFYKNYKKINVSDSVNGLFHSVLQSRKAVTQYIAINLSLLFLFLLIVVRRIMSDPSKMEELAAQNIDPNLLLFSLLTSFVLFLLIFALFYYLIYGRFIKRLKKNAAELNQLMQEEE